MIFVSRCLCIAALLTSGMLPFRFLRTANSAVRPRILRSLSSLPPSRLSSTVRHNSTRVPPVSTFASAPSTVASDAQKAARSDGDEPRLSLTFTCTAGSCTTRSTHQFTKRAYEKGIVLIECPGCKTRCVSLARTAVTYHKSAVVLTTQQAPDS